jgi:hypothetical protein
MGMTLPMINVTKSKPTMVTNIVIVVLVIPLSQRGTEGFLRLFSGLFSVVITFDEDHRGEGGNNPLPLNF